MKWHYVNADNDKVETSEEELRKLFDQGGIIPNTLVWNETMTEWAPYSSIFSGPKADLAVASDPYQAPRAMNTPAPAGRQNVDPAAIRHLSSFLGQNQKWLKFVGVVWMVIGILYCVTIVYAIFGWVFIWQGRILMQAADSLQIAQVSGDQASFETAQERISLAIKILGIMTAIGLGFTVLMIILYIILAIVGLSMGEFS